MANPFVKPFVLRGIRNSLEAAQLKGNDIFNYSTNGSLLVGGRVESKYLSVLPLGNSPGFVKIFRIYQAKRPVVRYGIEPTISILGSVSFLDMMRPARLENPGNTIKNSTHWS